MEKTNFTIKDIPSYDRPRERLLKYGAEVLSNAELIAIIIRTGNKNESAIALSNKIISTGDLNFLSECTVEELLEIKGIGKAKAAQIKAAVELSKRLKNFRSGYNISIRSPKDAADIIMEDMRHLKCEHLKVMFLNTKNVLINIMDLSIGSLNSSIVHPREIYTAAIRKSSSSIIVLHNHPSGDPTPSDEDINITKRLFEVGKLVGIDMLDHIIIGDGTYISMKEKGII